MDREQFWALIETAKAATGGDCRAQTAHLVAALGKRSVNDVLAWDRIYGDLMAESYRWDLWGAAYLINGGCSDDGFDYFRGWLLGQGRAIWQAALADPDSLADHPKIRGRRPLQGWIDPLHREDILVVAYLDVRGPDRAGIHRRGRWHAPVATRAGGGLGLRGRCGDANAVSQAVGALRLARGILRATLTPTTVGCLDSLLGTRVADST